MNNSEDHSVKCTGTVSIDATGTVPGFPVSDGDKIVCGSFPEMQMEIRGRGNSTWQTEKKPYKIRLKDKEALLGEESGASRHWVLLANCYDRTLLKDRVTARSSLNCFETESGEIWANRTPDFDETENDGTRYENDRQKNYIRGHMQAVEDALYTADYSSGGTSNYRNLMDVESAAKYWLVMQASYNLDAYGTGSTYLYKYRNDPKMYWGPLWDFDYAWKYNGPYEGFRNNHKWVRAMLHDTADGGFVKEVQRQWPTLSEQRRKCTK